MAHKRRTEQEHQLTVSDEAAAYIADALMQLALEFENTTPKYVATTKHLRQGSSRIPASSISSANPRPATHSDRPRGAPALPPTSSVRQRRRLFPRPDRGSPRPSRADAVKAGRHAKLAARPHASRPSLYGGEHGGMLDPLGRSIRVRADQCPIPNRCI